MPIRVSHASFICSMGIPVVNVLWLYDCLRQKALLPTGKTQCLCNEKHQTEALSTVLSLQILAHIT